LRVLGSDKIQLYKLKRVGCESMALIYQAQDKVHHQAFINTVTNLFWIPQKTS